MPGVSETLDWVAGAHRARPADARCSIAVEQTLGVVLKAKEDIDAVRGAAARQQLSRTSGADVGRLNGRCTSHLLTTCSYSAGCFAGWASTCTWAGCSTSSRRCSTSTSAERDQVFHTCRALLVHRREDLAVFDRAFDAFWRGAPGRRARHGGRPLAGQPRHGRSARPTPTAPSAMQMVGDAVAGDGTAGALRTWSDAARLADKDFAAVHADESRACPRRARTPELESRRAPDAPMGDRARAAHRHAAGAGRSSVRTGGDVVTLPTPQAPDTPAAACAAVRRQRLDGALLAHAAALRARAGRRHRRVEAFLFSTQLTRITPALRTRRRRRRRRRA